MSELTRRRLLRLAGVALPAALLPLRPWEAIVDVVPASADRRLSGLLGEPASARAIGREYLRTAPATRDELVTAIAERLPGGQRGVARAGDGALRRDLASCVRSDFAAERVVVLRGWVLSQTEARLCALTALDAPPHG